MKITVTSQEITIETGDNTPIQRYAVVDWLNHPPLVSWTAYDPLAFSRKDPEFTVTADVVPMRDLTGDTNA